MSCALQSPEAGVCANKRPVRGRRVPTAQAQLTPLAAGHERYPAVAATAQPFSASAPESTFTVSLLHEQPPAPPQPLVSEPVAAMRTTPPRLREIRAGRAAAAGRAPVAEVRIPIGAVDAPSLPVATPMRGMEQLVERVRTRTAARISRSSAQLTS